MKDRLILLKASIVNTFHNETAYWADNLASLVSTTTYNIAYLSFIGILYANTKTIAGYTYNEMLLFYFIFEVIAYTNGSFILWNMDNLIQGINRGELDLILTKPMPSLFFVSIKNMRIFSFLRDGGPPLLLVASFINWGNFNFSLINLSAAVIIFLCGAICLHVILLFGALPAFWLGESNSIMNLFNEIAASSGSIMPFEGYEKPLRIIFTLIIPSLFFAAIPASVLLGRIDPVAMVIVAVLVTFVMLQFRTFAWNFALRHYTSASS